MHVNIPIVDRFVAYLADERHFSPYTGRCYAMDLSQYADSLCATGKISLDMAVEMAAMESRKANIDGRSVIRKIWRRSRGAAWLLTRRNTLRIRLLSKPRQFAPFNRIIALRSQVRRLKIA